MSELEKSAPLPNTTVALNILLKKREYTGVTGLELIQKVSKEPYNVVPNVVTISTLLNKEIGARVGSREERYIHLRNAQEILETYRKIIDHHAPSDEILANMYLRLLFMQSDFKNAVQFAQSILGTGAEQKWTRQGFTIFGESLLIWLPENHEFRRAIVAVFSQHPELHFIIAQAEKDKLRYGDIFDAWAREANDARLERFATGSRVITEGLTPVNTLAAQGMSRPRRKK